MVAQSAPLSPSLRNSPVQARSTARLARLLDATAEVIDEIGFERVTTAMVAERAGASIGTVYRYFPERIALLEAASARNASEFVAEMDSALRDKKHKTWQDAISAAVDLYARSFSQKKGFRSLRFGDVIDVRPMPKDRTNISWVAGVMASTVADKFEVDAGPALALRIETALHLADALLARAYSIKASGDKAFIDEAKSVVRGYLQ